MFLCQCFENNIKDQITLNFINITAIMFVCLITLREHSLLAGIDAHKKQQQQK